MTKAIEQLYQDIGREAVALAKGRTGKLLIYAEVEHGVISADVFYVSKPDGRVRYRRCSEHPRDLIYKLWERWQKVRGNKEWRIMEYVVEGEGFTLDFTYPDQIDEREDVSDRRPRSVKKHFGEVKVDFSNP